MSLLKDFTENVRAHNLFQEDDWLLVAVSGGADSIVLCELCHQAGFKFEILHCNFRLRAAESERDEAFVKSLGEKYQVPVTVQKFDTQQYALDNKMSVQVAARDLRYRWFMKIAAERSATANHPEGLENHNARGRKVCVLTAHHADDSIETLLINFFKGTGIHGLQGIKAVQELSSRVVRPLLFARKEDILTFVHAHHLDYVEDSSNESNKYTRNFFRNELIPSIRKVFPQVEGNLLKNIERLAEAELLYDEAVRSHKAKLVEYKGNEIHIPVLKLVKSRPLKTILYEILKDYHFSPRQTSEVIELLKSDSGKYVASSTHKAIKNRKWLIISPDNPLNSAHVLVAKEDREIVFELGKLSIEASGPPPEKIPESPFTAVVDGAFITYPLLLRKWKQGDYFYPLGMQKKKKLSRFFIDRKKSLSEKKRMWVLQSNHRIIWVVGERIDDRFKITDKTREAVVFKLIGREDVM